MTPETQMLLSGALTFGVPLALAVRELLTLERTGGGRSDPEPPCETSPAPVPHDDLALPPLPACLVPTLPPVERAQGRRVLEDA